MTAAQSAAPQAEAGELVVVPRVLIENMLNSTNVPRFRRMCEAALAAPLPKEPGR